MLKSNIKYLIRHHYLKLQDVTFRVSDDSALNFFMKITARLLTPMVNKGNALATMYILFLKIPLNIEVRNISLNQSTTVTDQASDIVTVSL